MKMRIVPAEATEKMSLACGRLYDRCAIENYGAPPDAEAVYEGAIAAAPSAGRVTREAVERVARALCRWEIARQATNSYRFDDGELDRVVNRVWRGFTSRAEAAIAALGIEMEGEGDAAPTLGT